MQISIEQAFTDLMAWCRGNDFAGHDPFDALNSKAFQLTPFSRSRTARLLWTQALKRSPVNLRPVLSIPKQKNSKGIALFGLAALATYRRLKNAETAADARALLDVLSRMRIDARSGAAWGYNFPWQSRKFFAPQGTPMIVPTAFAARAFIEAYEVFADEEYLQTARSTCNFIVNDLVRTVSSADEVCFSYSPDDTTQIFNASLLAGETLASVGRLTQESELCDLAMRAARYVVRRQNADGSWFYGTDAGQEWVDNFHTAYVLLSLARISDALGRADGGIESSLQRGFSFWRKGFFLADGWPKYYHDSLYPADAHAAATAIVTLLELQRLDAGARDLAATIAAWTIDNLRDSRGFFYYQRRRLRIVRTPFMRWTQAWMLYALSRLLET